MFAAAAKRMPLLWFALFALAAFALVGGSAAAPPDKDRTAPTKPANVHVTAATTTTVTLAWDPSHDDSAVVAYYVYGDGGKATVDRDLDKPKYTVSGLACGQSVQLGIVAVDGAQNRSERAIATVSASPCTDQQPPTMPSGFVQAETSQTAVVLTWRPSYDNVGVVGYDVYRYLERVASPAAPNATLAGLSCGSNYEYAVDAVDAAGNRSPLGRTYVSTGACPTSPPPTNDTQAPSAPGNLAASNIAQTSLALTWNGSSDNVGVTGYDVYRDGTKVASPTSTNANLSGLNCATSYAFAVQARDLAGNVSSQTRLTVGTAACSTAPPPTNDTQAPSAPGGLMVTSATANSVSVDWDASSDNVGVEGYRLYRDKTFVSTTAQTSATASELSCGRAYTLEVDAFDAAGNASHRASVVGATQACADTEAPSAPTGVVASSRTATSITLTWSGSTDNVGVVGYGLYRGGALVDTSSSTTGIFSGLNCNTNYTLATDAFDAAGNRSAKVTLMVSTTACPDTTPPTAPTNLAAANVTQTSVSLTWNASTDDTAVAAYDVYRNGTKVESVTTRSSVQSNLVCGTSYVWEVLARDAAGNASGRARLVASSADCATTPTACATGEFQARYMSNMTLSGAPVVTRCERSIDYDWRLGSPDASIPADGFSARWTGQFDFASGATDFSITADDGVRVFLDGAVIVDAWLDQSPTTYSTTKNLTAGSHQVSVEYYERTGGAVAKLSWSTGSAPPPPAPSSSGRWFSSSSPWNTAVPSNTAVVSQSSNWMNALYSGIGGINVNQGSWTPNVFTAAQSDPVQTMRNQDGWIVDSVPVPRNFQPSSDADAHAIILAPWLGVAYEFFGLRKDSTGKWAFYSADVIRLGGSGWWDGTYSSNGLAGPWGPRASGAALTGGLIRAEDVQSGTIPHALACAAPKNLIGPPVSPARTSDGGGGAGAMPMGSRLQLDPSLNVASLGLEPGEEMIARALQTYGAYIVDSSSAFACYAENTSQLGSNPYPSSWANGIRRDLVLKMRVVAAPPPPAYDNRSTTGQPHK